MKRVVKVERTLHTNGTLNPWILDLIIQKYSELTLGDSTESATSAE